MKKRRLLILLFFVPAFGVIAFSYFIGELAAEHQQTVREQREEEWNQEIAAEKARALYQREFCGDGWAEYDIDGNLICINDYQQQNDTKTKLIDFLKNCKDENGYFYKFDDRVFQCRDLEKDFIFGVWNP